MMLELKTTIELITPDRARQLLTLNLKNRPLVKSNLKGLTDIIKTGKWMLNGDAIRISRDNVLIDGQHRLQAIIDTGIPCESLVVYGLGSEVFKTIDIGAARTMSHTLAVSGAKNNVLAAACIPHISRYKAGGVPVYGCGGKPSVVAKHEGMIFYELNKELIDFAASFITKKTKLKSWLSPSYAVFLAAIFAEIDKDGCIDFLSRLENGDFPRESPLFVLREKLINSTIKKNIEIKKHFLAAYTIKTWNAVRSGNNIKILRWTTEGDSKEDFPRAI